MFPIATEIESLRRGVLLGGIESPLAGSNRHYCATSVDVCLLDPFSEGCQLPLRIDGSVTDCLHHAVVLNCRQNGAHSFAAEVNVTGDCVGAAVGVETEESQGGVFRPLCDQMLA